jgi:hypothetical protein
MKIDQRKFCGLSKSKNFQSFLRENYPILFQGLIEHLQQGKGCGANKNKMIEIYKEIEKVDGIPKLVEFLQNVNPSSVVVENPISINDKNPVVSSTLINPYVAFEARSSSDLFHKLNIHNVFDIFKPGVFMIPQRMIVFDITREGCANKVVNFIRNKINTDYVILKGPKYWHGYIEYFEPQHNEEAKKINIDDRPISRYKKKFNLER